MVSVALYQPDIPQNCGAMLRLGACLGVPVEVIGPAGFDMSDARLRRAGMDYVGQAVLTRHTDWHAFLAWRGRRRLVLLTTKASTRYTDHAFRGDDILLLGRESAGVPDHVHDIVDARLKVPLVPSARSMNVVTAAAMVLGEALRQTGGFPMGA